MPSSTAQRDVHLIPQLLAGAGQGDVHRDFGQLKVQFRFLVHGDEFKCTPVDVHLLTGILLEEVDHLLQRLTVEVEQRHLRVRKLGQQTLVGRGRRVATLIAPRRCVICGQSSG